MYFLKYRPQKIEELDLENVRRELKKILDRESLPHAFLFAGPRGAGKTSAARILAKAVNCQKSKDVEPCNDCPICEEVTKGNSLDVVEIDAASNRGIDDIRDLKEKVGLAPIKSKYKVYIIDEAHMLTRDAFNALLKTLEEPPAHVIFVLCTTEPEKIIPTVLSRLLRVNFNRGTDKEVDRSLKKVIKGEKLKVGKKVLDTIIGLADGSFRDAQKLLETLFLSSGKKITWEKTEKYLAQWQAAKPEKLLEWVVKRETKQALNLLEDLVKKGVNFKDYLKELLNLVQQLVLLKIDVVKDKRLISLADKFSLEELIRLSDLLSNVLLEQKTTLIPQMPLQIALVDFIAGSLPKPKLTKVKNKVKSVKLEKIKQKWEDLLSVVKPMNHSVSAFLRAARPIRVKGDRIVLEFFYKFHRDKIKEDVNRWIVEKGLRQVCGSDFKIECVLGKKSKENKKKEELSDMAEEIFNS